MPGKGEHISGVEYLTGSITDFEAVNQATKGVDGIFHLAGVVIHSRLVYHAFPLCFREKEKRLEVVHQPVRSTLEESFLFLTQISMTDFK